MQHFKLENWRNRFLMSRTGQYTNACTGCFVSKHEKNWFETPCPYLISPHVPNFKIQLKIIDAKKGFWMKNLCPENQKILMTVLPANFLTICNRKLMNYYENFEQVIFNRSSRRKRGMASNPLFIIPDFFFHLPNELCYGYLRFEGNGKIPLVRQGKRSALLDISVQLRQPELSSFGKCKEKPGIPFWG